MKPVVCMVTEGTVHHSGADRLVARAKAAARAGAHLIQIREPGLEAGALTSLVARCVEAVSGTRARIIVNDRIDVAMAAGAHGVHLRGDSVPGGRARAIVPRGIILGRSVHTVDEAAEAAAAGGLDYLIVGTVFESRTKPGARPAGTVLLADVVSTTTLPVLAIGGITAARAGAVAAAGAAGFAGIELFTGPLEGLAAVIGAASLGFEESGSWPTSAHSD